MKLAIGISAWSQPTGRTSRRTSRSARSRGRSFEFEPRTNAERDAVEEMAIAKWRQRRYWGTEAATLDLQMDKQAKEIAEQFKTTDELTRLAIAFQTLSDNSNALRLLDRYLAGIRRDYDRAFQRLLELRILSSPQPSGRRKPDFTEQTGDYPFDTEQ